QPAEPMRPAAAAKATPQTPQQPEPPQGGGRGGEQGRRGPAGPARPSPAPMNVPVRPKVVGPAGPTLKVQTPVKLTGPKVVRIEAPEVIDRPKPRRYGPIDGGPGRD